MEARSDLLAELLLLILLEVRCLLSSVIKTQFSVSFHFLQSIMNVREYAAVAQPGEDPSDLGGIARPYGNVSPPAGTGDHYDALLSTASRLEQEDAVVAIASRIRQQRRLSRVRDRRLRLPPARVIGNSTDTVLVLLAELDTQEEHILHVRSLIITLLGQLAAGVDDAA